MCDGTYIKINNNFSAISILITLTNSAIIGFKLCEHDMKNKYL